VRLVLSQSSGPGVRDTHLACKPRIPGSIGSSAELGFQREVRAGQRSRVAAVVASSFFRLFGP